MGSDGGLLKKKTYQQTDVCNIGYCLCSVTTGWLYIISLPLSKFRRLQSKIAVTLYIFDRYSATFRALYVYKSIVGFFIDHATTRRFLPSFYA